MDFGAFVVRMLCFHASLRLGVVIYRQNDYPGLQSSFFCMPSVIPVSGSRGVSHRCQACTACEDWVVCRLDLL